jgi:hypothetical protein
MMSGTIHSEKVFKKYIWFRTILKLLKPKQKNKEV